jgi:hypothetical protein
MAQLHRPWVIDPTPGRNRSASSHLGFDRDGRRRSTEPEGWSPAAIAATLVVLAVVLAGAGGWAIWRSEQDEAALAEAAEELKVVEREFVQQSAPDCSGSEFLSYDADSSIYTCMSDGDTGIGWTASGAQAGLSWFNLEVAELPASCIPGQTFVVVDGQTVSDCSVGGGGRIVHCVCVGEHAFSSLAALVSE